MGSYTESLVNLEMDCESQKIKRIRGSILYNLEKPWWELITHLKSNRITVFYLKKKGREGGKEKGREDMHIKMNRVKGKDYLKHPTVIILPDSSQDCVGSGRKGE